MRLWFSLVAEHAREDRRTKIGDPMAGLTKHVDFEVLATGIDAAEPRLSRDKGRAFSVNGSVDGQDPRAPAALQPS